MFLFKFPADHLHIKHISLAGIFLFRTNRPSTWPYQQTAIRHYLGETVDVFVDPIPSTIPSNEGIYIYIYIDVSKKLGENPKMDGL